MVTSTSAVPLYSSNDCTLVMVTDVEELPFLTDPLIAFLASEEFIILLLFWIIVPEAFTSIGYDELSNDGIIGITLEPSVPFEESIERNVFMNISKFEFNVVYKLKMDIQKAIISAHTHRSSIDKELEMFKKDVVTILKNEFRKNAQAVER